MSQDAQTYDAPQIYRCFQLRKQSRKLSWPRIEMDHIHLPFGSSYSSDSSSQNRVAPSSLHLQHLKKQIYTMSQFPHLLPPPFALVCLSKEPGGLLLSLGRIRPYFWHSGRLDVSVSLIPGLSWHYEKLKGLCSVSHDVLQRSNEFFCFKPLPTSWFLSFRCLSLEMGNSLLFRKFLLSTSS